MGVVDMDSSMVTPHPTTRQARGGLDSVTQLFSKLFTTNKQLEGLKSGNGRDVTKRAIMSVNSIVSGQNYDILTSIITSPVPPVPKWKN